MARERADSIGKGARINDANESPRFSSGSPRPNSPLPLSPLSTSSPSGSPRRERSSSLFGRKKSVDVDMEASSNNNGSCSSNNPQELNNEDLRKLLLSKTCPDNSTKCNYLGSPRRASLVSKSPSPLIPPLKLTQSISLNTVDPCSTTNPSYINFPKTDSNESLFCSSEDEACDSDDEHKKDEINQIIRKLSISEDDGTDDAIDKITLSGNKAMEARLKILTRGRANSYVREDELRSACGDDYGIRSVLAVNEVLSSDIKTIQSLLDDKMILLRALFDVPEYGEYNNVALWVSTIYLAHDKAMNVIKWAIKQEVENAESENALFRADSMSCALIANFVRLLGRTYLQKVIGPHILKMYQTTKSYEIDLNREKGAKANATRLRKLARALLKSVFKSIPQCPRVIREFLYQMRASIRERFPDSVALKTVSSFFFLRFVSPAVLYPASCGILEPLQHPSITAQRGLVLAGKILQNLANGVSGEEYTEAHLTKINKVLVTNSGPMNAFMEKLCQKPEGHVDILDECFPTQQQYKNAVHDLQKYITEKIATIPKIRNEDTEETEPMMRLIKLRRALQSYSYTWRNPSPKLNAPPTPNPNQLLNSLMSGSPVHTLGTSYGSMESCESMLSLASCKD